VTERTAFRRHRRRDGSGKGFTHGTERRRGWTGMLMGCECLAGPLGASPEAPGALSTPMCSVGAATDDDRLPLCVGMLAGPVAAAAAAAAVEG
jgi:hypothetical protein